MSRPGTSILLSRIIPKYNQGCKSMLINRKYLYIMVSCDYKGSIHGFFIIRSNLRNDSYISSLVARDYVQHTVQDHDDILYISYGSGHLAIWGKINNKNFDTSTGSILHNDPTLFNLHRYNIICYLRQI